MPPDAMDLERMAERVRAEQDEALSDPRRRAAVRRRLLAPRPRRNVPRLVFALLAPAALAAMLALLLRPGVASRHAQVALEPDPEAAPRADVAAGDAPEPAATRSMPEPIDAAARSAGRGSAARSRAGVAAAPARAIPPAAPIAAPSPALTPPDPTPADAAPTGHFRELAAQARYGEAMTEARRAGLETIVRSASATELLSLATVARRAGDPAVGAIYEAIRERFPGSVAASDAAFLRGRDAMHRGEAAAAVRDLETYLAEQPEGGHVRDALGRLIEARTATGDAAGARRAAEQYLARYPRGPHAALASSLVP